MEKTRPEEVEDDIEDVDDGPYTYDDPTVGALLFVRQLGDDMSIKVMSEDPDSPTVHGAKMTRLSPDMLRAWYILKEKGAISLRSARREPKMYVAMLELYDAGLLKQLMTRSGFIAFDYELDKRIELWLTKAGEEISKELGCSK